MECKVLSGVYIDVCCDGFNRNIVECKVLSFISIVSLSTVVIETLWNVKAFVVLPVVALPAF